MMNVHSGLMFLNWCNHCASSGSSLSDINLLELRVLESAGLIELCDRENIRSMCGITSAEEATQAEHKLEELSQQLHSTFSMKFLVKSRLNSIIRNFSRHQRDTLEETQERLQSQWLKSSNALRVFREFIRLNVDSKDNYIRATPHGHLLLKRFLDAGRGSLFLESPTSESDIGVFRVGLPWHGVLTIKEINEAARTLHMLVTEHLLNVALDIDRKLALRPCDYPFVITGRGRLLAEAHNYCLEHCSYAEERKEILVDKERVFTWEDDVTELLSTELNAGFHLVDVETEDIVIGYRPPTDEECLGYRSMGWSYGYDGPVPNEIPICEGRRISMAVLYRLLPSC